MRKSNYILNSLKFSVFQSFEGRVHCNLLTYLVANQNLLFWIVKSGWLFSHLKELYHQFLWFIHVLILLLSINFTEKQLNIFFWSFLFLLVNNRYPLCMNILVNFQNKPMIQIVSSQILQRLLLVINIFRHENFTALFEGRTQNVVRSPWIVLSFMDF